MIKNITLIFISGFFLYFPDFSFGFILKLHPEIGVNVSSIKIKDLGEIVKDKDDITISYLKEMVIFRTPSQKTIYSNAEIQKILTKKIGKSVIVNGDNITITPLFTIILLQEITEKIKTTVTEIYKGIPRDIVNVIYMGKLKQSKVLATNFNFRVIVPKGKIGPVKYVRLEIKNKNEILLSESIPIKLIFAVDVYKSKKKFRKNQIVSKKELEIVKKTISTDPREYILFSETGNKIKLAQPIRKGEILLQSKIL